MWFPQEVHAHDHILEAGEAPCEPIDERLNLESFIDGEDSPCMTRILHQVCDGTLSTAEPFKLRLELHPTAPQRLTPTYLQNIISSLDSKDEAVRSAWLETLLDTIGLLPVDIVNKDILYLAQQKAQLHSSIDERVTAGKLLGRVAQRLDATAVQNDVLSLLLSLCQDVQSEVRACACSQLGHVARALRDPALARTLIPCLVELASDGDGRVRLAACSAVVHALPSLPTESVVTALCMKLAESALSARDDVWLAMAQLYGPMCCHLGPALRGDERRWFVDKYAEFARVGGRRTHSMPDLVLTTQGNAQSCADCRFHCAFNFPAMAVFASAGGADCTVQLYSVLDELAADPCAAVRRTIASGLHEVVHLLDSDVLRSNLLMLLRDDSCEVLDGLIPHLGQCLVAMSECRAFREQEERVCSSLLRCAAMLARSLDWRLHTLWIEQLQCLPQVLPSDVIYTHFVSLMFDLIHNARPRPVRLAACKTLLHLLRHNTCSSQRSEILRRINTELSQGHSCYSRLLFIQLAAFSLDIFSRQYFKEHFCLALLDRAEDRVSNNRLASLSLFLRVLASLSLPADKRLVSRMRAIVKRLAGDDDDGVRRRVRQVDAVLDAGWQEQVDLEDARRLADEALIDASLDERPTLQHPTKSRPHSGLVYGETERRRSSRNSGSLLSPPEVIRRPSTPALAPISPNTGDNLPSLEREFLRDAGIRLSRIPSLSLSDIGILTDSASLGLLSKQSVKHVDKPSHHLHPHGSYLDKLDPNSRRSPEPDWIRTKPDDKPVPRQSNSSYLDKLDRESRRSDWLRAKPDDGNRRYSSAEMDVRLTSGASRRHSALCVLESRLKPPGFAAKPRATSPSASTSADKHSDTSKFVPISRLGIPASLNAMTISRTLSSAIAVTTTRDILPSQITAKLNRLETPLLTKTTYNNKSGNSNTQKSHESSARFTFSKSMSFNKALNQQATSKITSHGKIGTPAPSKSSPSTRAGSPTFSKFVPNPPPRFLSPKSTAPHGTHSGHVSSRTAPNSRPGSPTYSKFPPKTRPLSFTPTRTTPSVGHAAQPASKTTPNSRSGSPTRGSGKGFQGFRGADVGSRLPVRRKV